jgi:NAD(P)H-dependent FMN reductase
MTNKKNILAICGSTRKSSTNLELIQAIIDLYKSELNIELFHEIDHIPHFNPDLDNEDDLKEVALFREKIKAADGVLICTPEYAMGVPGTLKNAIDWTVSSMEFSHKPVALITASSQGFNGHASLLATLKIIESDIPENSQVVISFVKTKVKGDRITDEKTLMEVKVVMSSLIKAIEEISETKIS